MNITEILVRQAATIPDKPAIIDRFQGRDRATSFRELEQAVGRTSALLRRNGLRPGQTALLLHPMSAELYIALAAILRVGMTAMFVDPSAGRRAIDRCCEMMPPHALVASSKAHMLRLISRGLRQIPQKWSIGFPIPGASRLEAARHGEGDNMVEACSPDTPALVSFTSGSTGAPKATIRTHQFLLAQHEAIESSFDLRLGDTELVTMPIFVLANLASGLTSIIADADLKRPGQIRPQPVLQQIQRNAANRISASPAFLEQLLGECDRADARLRSLTKIFTGGGPVPPRLLDRVSVVAPQAEVMVVYGSTEAEPISTIRAAKIRVDDRRAMEAGKGLLVGKPVDAIDVRIIADDQSRQIDLLDPAEFQAMCQKVGEPGEITVAGRHVLAGYVDAASNREHKFRVQATVWHRTGDAGFLDSEGRLWLLGRCAARIKDDRGVLYPLGVEQVAMQHSGIRQAALVSHRGRRVLALTGVDRQSLPDLDALKKSLSFAHVDTIQIRKHLPVDRRHNSKIDYSALVQSMDS